MRHYEESIKTEKEIRICMEKTVGSYNYFSTRGAFCLLT